MQLTLSTQMHLTPPLTDALTLPYASHPRRVTPCAPASKYAFGTAQLKRDQSPIPLSTMQAAVAAHVTQRKPGERPHNSIGSNYCLKTQEYFYKQTTVLLKYKSLLLRQGLCLANDLSRGCSRNSLKTCNASLCQCQQTRSVWRTVENACIFHRVPRPHRAPPTKMALDP